MSQTREDKAYADGWRDGYKHAIEDIRQELLPLHNFIPLEVFEKLNKMKGEENEDA